MCILFFHYQPEDAAFPYLLIAASNRDEVFFRRTAPAAFWEDHPSLLAGRDIDGGLTVGGTWLGITRDGRFGVLTNYRTPRTASNPQARSRGHLVLDYLLGTCTSLDYSRKVVGCGHEYNGYNLITGAFQGPQFSSSQLVYSSNKEGTRLRVLGPGTYGLSNQLLDSPWKKVVQGKEKFSEIVERISPSVSKEELTEQLVQLLCDDTCLHPDPNVPFTGHTEAEVKARNSIFVKPINSETQYGTRTNTVVLVDRQGEVSFAERTLDPGTHTWTTSTFSFHIES